MGTSTTRYDRDPLACHGCGSTAGVQHSVAGRWLCLDCEHKMAEWAVEHGALHAYGDATDGKYKQEEIVADAEDQTRASTERH
jgi:ribosomal protein L37AE/L43A